MLVACDYGSNLLWWRSDSLRTSGFVDDVMFSCDWPYSGMTQVQQARCNAVCEPAKAVHVHILLTELNFACSINGF